MRTTLDRIRFAFALLAALSLSACLMDEADETDSPSSIEGLSITFTNPGGTSSIQTPDITVNILGTVDSKAGVDSVSWLNDRGGKGVAHGKDSWATGNIVLQLGNNKITITAKDLDGKSVSNTLDVVREDTTAAAPPDTTDLDPVVMYSYNSNLSAAAPVKGASINAKLVYVFVQPGSNWQDRGIASIRIRCCKGQAGPGVGEPYSGDVKLNRSPWSQLFDMTGYAAGGTRRVKISAEFNNGSSSDNLIADFTVAGTQGSNNRAPVISGSPGANATVGNKYNFRPTASDADGDTMQFKISKKPAWASFSTSTGRLSGTPAANHVGTYDAIVISVSDGMTTSRLAPFSITVGAIATGSATLSWSIPTERTDETSLNNDLAGFNIYYGQTPGDYGNVIKLTNPSISTFMVDNLSTGTWYFVITAQDKNGLESNPSGQGSKTF